MGRHDARHAEWAFRPRQQRIGHTSSWANNYWGGALFCLIADIEIRKRTSNRLGLRNAMRGVLAAGGNHEVAWPIERVLSVADAATEVDVLKRLHDEVAQIRCAWILTDMERIWFGKRRRWTDFFHDKAALAAIRDAVMR